MRKKLIMAYIVCIIFIITSGCNQEAVKYYSSDTEYSIGDECSEDADVNSVEVEEENLSTQEEIPVYVCGAVKRPGVYYISKDALKADALQCAGGLLEDGVTDFVNLAETVTSGEKIYFPYKGEVSDDYNISNQEPTSHEKININIATKEELMALPGIGESKAEAIIKYRQEYGPFHSIEDITNIAGIKEGVYNNIKEHIVVN